MTFSFSVVHSSDLKDVLVTLGANDLLDSKRAELTGIIKHNTDINNRLSLQHFIYNTRLDVTGKNDYLPAMKQNGKIKVVFRLYHLSLTKDLFNWNNEIFSYF